MMICVAIAYRSYEMKNVPTSEEELSHWSLPEDNLVLLAIIGLKVIFPLQIILSWSWEPMNKRVGTQNERKKEWKGAVIDI